MRLRDSDISTRDLMWGKYDSPMAVYLYYGLGIDQADDEWTDDQGTGEARYGRRVLSWDDRGFVYCTTFPTEAAAVEAWEAAHAIREAAQDAICGSQGCTGTVCRYCHETIHQVTEQHWTGYLHDVTEDSLCITESGYHDASPILDDDTSHHIWGCARDWIA
jgi:hypothetical protein